MLITIPDVLTPGQVAEARSLLESADSVDGRVTAGHQSANSKDNLQLPEGHPVARDVGELILRSLNQSPRFFSAALPLKIFPPLFNRYSGGLSFCTHVDNAIRQISNAPVWIRTDLSVTLYFEHPENYDGCELCVEDTMGFIGSSYSPEPSSCIRRADCTTSLRSLGGPGSVLSSGFKA